MCLRIQTTPLQSPRCPFGGKGPYPKIRFAKSQTMKTKVRIFFVSEKNSKFVVGEVEHHINGAILRSGIVGSMSLTRAGKIGQLIDFGQNQVTSKADSNSEYHRLTLA